VLTSQNQNIIDDVFKISHGCAEPNHACSAVSRWSWKEGNNSWQKLFCQFV